MAKLRGARYLRASTVEPLDLIAIEPPRPPAIGRKRPRHRPGEEVTVHVSNPLPFALEGLTLVLHYEGGLGKPMPRHVERALPTIASNETFDHRAPATLEKEGAVYGFASVSLEGRAGGCTFLPSTNRR